MSLAAKYTKRGTVIYRKGENGLDLATGVTGGLGFAQMAINTADAMQDPYGKPSTALGIGKGAVSGASMGMQIAGPWGAAVGGVAGGIAGLVSSGAQRRQYNAAQALKKQQEDTLEQNRTAARLSADPTLLTGNLHSGYYAKGGHLGEQILKTPVKGGSIKPLSSTAGEIKGPSHKNGGVQLPAFGAEVEGQETTNGSYVFSKELGFADLHKPIAKSIGKIESKAMSPERVNSLKLLKAQENQLKLSQEYIKQFTQ